MNEEAKAALDLRLARGEISPEDYTSTLNLLSERTKGMSPQATSVEIGVPPVVGTMPAQAGVSKKPGEAIGMILVMLPVTAAILAWCWVGSMRLIDGPGAKLGGLAALTVLLTAVLAAFEASQLGFGKNRPKPEHGSGDGDRLERVSPLGWFFSISLLWIIDYPRYLYARSRFGVRNLVGFGLLSMLLWVLALCVVGVQIASAHDRLQEQIRQIQQ